jgi:hypothetical protein
MARGIKGCRGRAKLRDDKEAVSGEERCGVIM